MFTSKSAYKSALMIFSQLQQGVTLAMKAIMRRLMLQDIPGRYFLNLVSLSFPGTQLGVLGPL
jgi:hypothetical protein